MIESKYEVKIVDFVSSYKAIILDENVLNPIAMDIIEHNTRERDEENKSKHHIYLTVSGPLTTLDFPLIMEKILKETLEKLTKEIENIKI